MFLVAVVVIQRHRSGVKRDLITCSTRIKYEITDLFKIIIEFEI